jgi:hypothetical protein
MVSKSVFGVDICSPHSAQTARPAPRADGARIPARMARTSIGSEPLLAVAGAPSIWHGGRVSLASGPEAFDEIELAICYLTG